MSRTGLGSCGAAARLLALLAVVLGLLRMHGLAGTHHSAATLGDALSPVTEQLVMPLTRTEPRQHDHAVTGALVQVARAGSSVGQAAVGPVIPACDDDCPTGVAALCAAVLAAAAATAWLIAATSRRRVPAAPAGGDRRVRAPGEARWLLPRVDPVAELCISRT